MQIEELTLGDSAPLWKAQLPGRPLSGLTVLVVEDSQYASEAMRLLCMKSGARIRRADSMRTAMRHLQTYRPGAIIVDMGLPDGDGADLIATITAKGKTAPVVLAISGDPEMREAALAAGAAGFIAKPIESLAAFQHAILSALPAEAQPRGPRIMPDDVVSPGKAALRDDLNHVADVLSSASNGIAVDYIAQFLAGVARSARDNALAEAAAALARDHKAGNGLATDLTRISRLVHERLGEAEIA